MKIIDCFTFYNEYKMLLLRLTELYDVVDHFVIVEAKNTFVGNSKELNFKNNIHLYQKFLDKIIYIVVDNMPNTDNPWDNEKYQRSHIDTGIKKLNLNDEDIIIISDCDEIPNKKMLENIKNNNINISNEYLLGLDMDFYYYYLTYKQSNIWKKAKLLRYSLYNKLKTSLRNDIITLLENIRVPIVDKNITNAGWHFSYFGGIEMIKNKIKNFSHREHNNYKVLCNIENNINKNNCIFNENLKFKYIKIEDNKNLPENYKILI